MRCALRNLPPISPTANVLLRGPRQYNEITLSYFVISTEKRQIQFNHPVFIPCGVWEAVYIIDGLLKNTSDIQPDIVHADTQGQSLPVFGLSHLLGIQLMPRIRNWQDYRFFRPDDDVRYEHIDALFRDTVDWDLIETHWKDLMRVVLSIKAGKIAASTLLRRLGNNSRKNRLYQAFRALGAAVRTLLLLQYISDYEPREQLTASTNKVETYNGFSKHFFFGGEGGDR